ncbi:asparagine synthetase B family protein [Lentisalinibacter salinarum]|uniref:hypothetical protein n=1 Tax=Lentisalinibacter salinarum TaxID=2992239 RepID=UPI00386BEBBB
MIRTGAKGPIKCSARIANGQVTVAPSETGALGYRADPTSPSSGLFVEWDFNGGILEVRNDPLGFIPIYYRYDSRTFEFSTSILALLDDAGAGQFDTAAIALFLRTGLYLSDRTPFSAIRVMPGGSRLRFGPNGFCLVAPDRPLCGDESPASLPETQAAYGDLFEAGISRFREMSLNKIAVPLSGGRDSRHILLELCRAGLGDITCVTVRSRSSDADVDVAGQLARRLTVPHITVGPVPNWVEAERRKNLLTNFNSKEHTWILPLADHFSASSYDGIFDGIGGDVLSQSKNLTAERLTRYRRGELGELAEEILGKEGYLPKMLAAGAYRQFRREDAKALLVEELERYVDTPNPVGQFFFWNRTRRSIASSTFGILAQRNPVFAPFLDIDLYRFLSSLPGELLVERRLHDEVIKARYPEYSDIDYADGRSTGQRDASKSRHGQMLQLARYFGKHSTGQKSFRRSFVYARLLKGMWSSSFCGGSIPAFTIPLYLNELHRAAAGEYS